MKEAKKILILGAGESGVGAALLAKHRGCSVFVSDGGKIKKQYKDTLFSNDISFEEGKHSFELFNDFELAICSPGISRKTPVIKYIENINIPCISEIEYASYYTNATKICITGSNGKTTTTSLIYHILKKAGKNVCLAGNIGKSFAQQVIGNKYDYYVLEISSFQLERMYDFKAEFAILLNITPDHMDWYDNSMEKYAEAKFRIFRNMNASDNIVYCADDFVVANRMKDFKTDAKVYAYTLSNDESFAAYLNGNNIIININQTVFDMSLSSIALKGRHNVQNSMAAAITARLLDIRKDIIKESFTDFQNVEHRLEFVSKVRGIEFINDSKATNVNATWYALESIERPIIWIAGGQDKGNDYNMLKSLVESKVKAIVCLGINNEKIINSFSNLNIPIIETMSAVEAVSASYHLGKPGDVVLLSPACASFDLFENYEDRGNQFKEAVRNL